ncbi:YHYH domain-containing protein [Methylophaga sp.]|uniref:YHYH domain-containing protein n=1 Tax=Methylophaga sp. TaxID=2024840 RepID=UPI0025D0F7E6|nr:YHYH domain-containing protein [Methylophaga sp.]
MKYTIIAMMILGSSSAIASQQNIKTTPAFVTVSDAVSHSGRTDSSGCHRDTKAGSRHCH